MAIVMINNEAAEAAQARISVGDIVTGTRFDGSRFELQCTAKGAYYLQLKGATSGMSIPISLTDAYQEELENMARMQMPAGQLGQAPKRGRPKGATTNAAPVEHPVQTQPQAQQPAQQPAQMPTIGDRLKGGEFDNFPAVQPSGIDYSKLGQQQPIAANYVALVEPSPTAITIHKAEGDPEWPRSAIDDIVNDFREKLTILVDGLEQEAEDDARDNVELPPAKKTCADCFNVDLDKNICGKFQCAVPITVIVDAKTKCPDYTDIDSEIPF